MPEAKLNRIIQDTIFLVRMSEESGAMQKNDGKDTACISFDVPVMGDVWRCIRGDTSNRDTYLVSYGDPRNTEQFGCIGFKVKDNKVSILKSVKVDLVIEATQYIVQMLCDKLNMVIANEDLCGGN